MTKITLDANVLFYAFDARDPVKQRQAVEIIDAAAVADCTLGLQAIGEFYVAVVRKLKAPPSFARDQVKSFLAAFETFGATANAHSVAAEETAAGNAEIGVLARARERALAEIGVHAGEHHAGADAGGGRVRRAGGRGRGTLKDVAEAVGIFRVRRLEARGVHVGDIAADDFETLHEGSQRADAAAHGADE